MSKIKGTASHHESELAELRADRELAVEYLKAAMESLDNPDIPSSINLANARVRADGSVHVVVSQRDPGLPNWLDTQGFAAGNLTYRNLMSSTTATFRTRLLRHADLDAALPGDSARVSANERVAGMRARFDGIRQRYGL